MYRPGVPCRSPGCPGIVLDGGKARCDNCRARRPKPTANSLGYGHMWRERWRAPFLKAHPWCCLCGNVAAVADHHPLSRAKLVAAGVANPDAPHRLRPLCKTCHDKETRRAKPGGFRSEDYS